MLAVSKRFRHLMFRLGSVIQKWDLCIVIISLLAYSACLYGWKDVVIETKIPKTNDSGGGFQVVIQSSSHENENVLSYESLMKHVELLEEISKYELEMYGENWTLADICFKPTRPNFNVGSLSKLLNTLFDKFIPCIWITPIDCYWEGSKLLGPNPPINLGSQVSSFVSSLPRGKVTWKNLNPSQVMEEVGNLFDLGQIGNFLNEKAGIGAGYLDRPCINPLDPECPVTAPNYFNRCAALTKFDLWNKNKGIETVFLRKTEIPREEEEEDTAEGTLNRLFADSDIVVVQKNEDYYDYQQDTDHNLDGNSTKLKKPTLTPEEIRCMEYGPALLEWMSNNKKNWGEFLSEEWLPNYPDYGEVMTGGCKGFGRNIMEWPEDLIMGGIKKENQKLKSASAKALRSVILLASPFDIFMRFKEPDVHPHLNNETWNPYMAEQVIVAWQRNFAKKLYNHAADMQDMDRRVFHPLASTTIAADMLEDLSPFNYGIIIVGCVLMIIYAAWTQVRFERGWLAIKSNVVLSVVGFLLITYSSICGQGLTRMMGIHSNLATTQMALFLSVGLGMIDMFLLLYTYDEYRDTNNRNCIGILLKETGISIITTSVSNILALCSGCVLPMSALRSFCYQIAVSICLNLASLIIIFPAFTSVLESKKDDLAENSTPATTRWYTVRGFFAFFYSTALKKTYMKVLMILISIALVILGLSLYSMHYYIYSLRWNSLFAICIIVVVVFAILSVLMNPWAALMVMVVIVVITIQLGGFMKLMGVKANPISAIYLISSVVIGMKFSTHLALCFLNAVGSLDDRLESCLQHVVLPVFHGAVSILLGFVMSKSAAVMSVLVSLGVVNSFCLLPILLSVVIPKNELLPVTGNSMRMITLLPTRQLEVKAAIEDLEHEFHDNLSVIAEEEGENKN